MNENPSTPAMPQKSRLYFVEMLENRYSYHKEKAEKNVRRFKPIAPVFVIAIPILAAIVAYSMDPKSIISEPVAAIIGLSLTLITIVNSVLRPDKKLSESMSNCISLDEWKLEFYIRVNQTNKLDEPAFHSMIQEMNKKLSEIGKAMAESSMPDQSA